MVHTYLQLRHTANELIGHLHVRAAGIVKRDKLGGQVLVAIEEPGVGEGSTGKGWEVGEDLVLPLSFSCSLHTEGCQVPKSLSALGPALKHT